jgi:GDP-L-fucose synthase
MKIFLTGGSGMVGRNFLSHSFSKKYEILSPTSKDLNLLDYEKLKRYIELNKPDIVIHAAGIVGGINANILNPLKFMYENMQMGINLILASRNQKIKRLMNLGSSCMYPKVVTNPISEESLLQGEFEPSNEGYALAKVTSSKLCQYVSFEDKSYLYKTVIPCNLYGKYDKFDSNKSHMVPSAILKIYNAKKNSDESVDIWGDGLTRREFMYAGDFADFIYFAINKFESLPFNINVGLGFDFTVNEYYKAIAEVIGYKGKFKHDISKPSGVKQKLIDISRLKKFGWNHKTSLKQGINKTYEFFLSQVSE